LEASKISSGVKLRKLRRKSLHGVHFTFKVTLIRPRG